MTTDARSLGVIDRVRQEVERNALRARNGIRMAAGLSRPKLGVTPKDVVWRRGRSELWHYHNDNVRVSPPLLIVFSLFSRSYILDLQPGNSFVEKLIDAGFDVYLLDWGVPDERDAANRIEDYVDDYIPAAVERVRHLSGAPEINLLGYCFGSVLSLMYAAHHPDAPLSGLTVLAAPADLQQMGPLTSVIGKDGMNIDNMLDADGNLPPQIIHQGFQVLKPTAQLTQYIDLWDRMWGDDYVTAYQAMTGWASDHIPLPGGVAKDLAQMVQDNAIVNDTLVIGGDRVSLSAITVPFLTVLATRDHIVTEASAAPLIDLVGSSDKHEMRLDAGHVGLLVGRTAAKTTIPTIIDFLVQRSEVTA